MRHKVPFENNSIEIRISLDTDRIIVRLNFRNDATCGALYAIILRGSWPRIT